MRFALALLVIGLRAHAQPDPLPSWNEGTAKQSVLRFVKAVTDRSSRSFVPPEDRIATFDQDGTLWVEHPLYTQALFALDRVHELAPQHPEWKTTEPFQSILADDHQAMSRFDEAAWEHIIAATHTGMSTQDFLELVRDWLAKARDSRFHKPYTELAYKPMLELMQYLRAKGFKTYIVTGGGQEFVRVYSERVYGVPPEQVIGSSVLTRYQNGKLLREPKVFFIDDHGGKPVGINLFIGKRPQAAFGNSTGDAEMLQWTQAQEGERLMLLVHHDDAEREYAYGPDTKVGTFPEALMNQAKQNGWIVVSMKKDWRRIFSFHQLAGR